MTHTASRRPLAKLSKTEMIDALKRSGYLIEGRLQTIISNDDPDWLTIPNDCYPDSKTEKSRELDMHAMRGFMLSQQPLAGKFLLSLFVECVNNPSPLVLFTRASQFSISQNIDFIKMAGLPAVLVEKTTPNIRQPLPSFLEMYKYHHYAQGPVANQFCSFSKKNNSAQLMASHQEEHFNCFEKLIAAVQYYTDLHYKTVAITDPPTATLYIYYPALVLQGELYEAQTTRRAVTLRKADHLQYRQSTYINNLYLRYQIDVMTERFFPKYLKMIRNEFDKTSELLRKNSSRLIESLEILSQSTRGHDRLMFPAILS